MENVVISISVFLLVYIALTFELVNKAAAALGGVAALLILQVVSVHRAASFIDYETIMLLLGMMILVGVLKNAGLFNLISVKIATVTRGSPLRILVLFSCVTALMSAFLDNVTTVLILIPIIIQLTRGMGLNPKPYVISQSLISNIGGTATLIGDPPNIIIGSKVGLPFNAFLVNLSIPVLIAFVSCSVYIWATNRSRFRPITGDLLKLLTVQMLLDRIRFEFEETGINKPVVYKGVGCLLLAIGMFVTQTITGLTPGTAALAAAMLLLIIARVDVEHTLLEVEWSTLLFFTGLFILVGVLEEEGVIRWIAENVFMRIGDNPYVIVLVVLWVSGLFSGFLDNIPFTVTMIPIIQHMLESTPIPHNILWWSLALGACFGGNFTYIGASANVVSVGMSEKNDVSISFIEFMRTGTPVTIISLLISSLYLSIYLYLSL